MQILHQLKAILTNLLAGQQGISHEQLESVSFALATDPQKQQFGDISTNAALILAPLKGMAPRAVAEELRTELRAAITEELVARIEIAGPGFINLFLAPQAFQAMAEELLTQGAAAFAKPAGESTKHYVVEFVSANPTGPMHLGHGRNGIIGDVLTRILRLRGHQVTAEFYINDAGSQIKKLGQSLQARVWQQASETLKQRVVWQEEWYQGEYLVELAEQCLTEIRKNNEDPAELPVDYYARYAYKHLLSELDTTLQQYGINFDVWFSEQQLHTPQEKLGGKTAIDVALEKLQAAGALYEEEGALWFRSTAYGDDKDRVVRKNTGELTYVAADIAYLLNKIERGFDTQVMVLGQDHHGYVERLKAVLKALGHDAAQLQVILYQLVTIKSAGEQVRMSKRKGTIVGLKDVIETVGCDVARFFYLNRKADAHLEFNIDLALQQTEENPVFYLQYAYVRTASILDKAAAFPQLTNISIDDCKLLTPADQLLIKKIAALDELLGIINKNLQTHMIAYYTLELAHMFHSYYALHRIIDPEQVSQSRGRLLLTQIVRSTLGTCFDLLGISKPHRM